MTSLAVIELTPVGSRPKLPLPLPELELAALLVAADEIFDDAEDLLLLNVAVLLVLETMLDEVVADEPCELVGLEEASELAGLEDAGELDDFDVLPLPLPPQAVKKVDTTSPMISLFINSIPCLCQL
ncbi:MAG: hypothetical protein AAGC78_12430 [Cellvibrio sp.]|uniref:hypothetical protein n=1 Tax=Cellvibrio sp. TaxID=1965322 RepID=UPI0031B24A71